MSALSNLYAEKVFAEHPIGLWPLDEKSDYINLLLPEYRNFDDDNLWDVSGGSVQEVFSQGASPFSSEKTFRVSNDSSFNVDLFADNVTSFYFNPELKTFSVGFYMFVETDNIQSVGLSVLTDPPGKPFYQNVDAKNFLFEVSHYRSWQFYRHTFDLFEEDFVPLDAIFAPEEFPANFVKEDHGFKEGDKILLTSTGSLPQNLLENTVYYVKYLDDNSFNVATSPGGDPVFASFAGSGIHTAILIKSIGLSFRVFLSDDNPGSALLNGLTIGQWSEEFQSKSFGVELEEINGIEIQDGFQGIRTAPYGLFGPDAFYLAKNNVLLAKNTGLPLLFGSENVTSLYPHPQNQPSIIFPGLGFLNESGKFRTYTVEFWMRLNCDLPFPFRIFGPISSTDGLYLENGLLMLKIGRFSKSHYVGDSYRPMLINIVYGPGIMSLVINGEKVFDLSYDFDEIIFPENISSRGREQDWLGFYSNKQIFSFDIDSFAIYPYRVATAISKRRFVLGQGVEFPDGLISLYDGKSFLAEYSFSNHATNYSYPDIGSWNSGSLDNIQSSGNVLSPPNYKIPSFVFSNKNFEEWQNDLRSNSRGYISLKPSEAWEETEGYIFFDNINLSQQNVKSFYGVFEARVDQEEAETLFKLENGTTGHFLEATLEKIEQVVSDFEEKDGLVFVKPSHNFKDGDLISFVDNGSILPTGVFFDKEYRVSRIGPNSFSISESVSSPPINSFKKIDAINKQDFPSSITAIDHDLKDNDPLLFVTTKSLPKGILKDTIYYAKILDKDTFLISLNPIGESFDADSFMKITSSGVGTHSFKRVITGDLLVKKFAVCYYLVQNIRQKVHESGGVSLGHSFVAGIDIDSFSNFFGGNASTFLKNIRQLRVYFGGSRDLSQTFSGKIQRIGFANRKNSAKLKFLFDKTGIPFLGYQFDGNGVVFPETFNVADGGDPYTKYIDDILSHISSYTLLVQNELGSSELEIATSSSWQDYVPLSYFAKKVLLANGSSLPRLNFLQFNLDYPTPERYRNGFYDTANSAVKAYISFQFIKDGANRSSLQFAQTLPPPQNNTVIPGNEWFFTRYEVTSSSIIYVPPRVNPLDLAIVIDIEVDTPGLMLKPVRVKNLSLSGVALNEFIPNPIGSRSGYQAFPYARLGLYTDFDDTNPFSIYRDNTPHLYLTKQSGLKLEGDLSDQDNPLRNRGIEFVVNPELKRDFALSALNLFIRLEGNKQLGEDIPLFEFQSGLLFYAIRARSIHPANKRFQLYAVDQSGNLMEDLGFYLNGVFVKNPTISLGEWNSLGIGFANPVLMPSRIGQFRVTGPVLFNNFSYYALTESQKTKLDLFAPRKKFFTEDLYIGVDLKEIFAIYTGTNVLIARDRIPLQPKNYQYSVFKNNSLRTRVYTGL
jgi:hypothetical protein